MYSKTDVNNWITLMYMNGNIAILQTQDKKCSISVRKKPLFIICQDLLSAWINNQIKIFLATQTALYIICTLYNIVKDRIT